jgi:undecaprenyl-diphosphatase
VLAWSRVNKQAKIQFVIATILAGIFAVLLAKIAAKLYYYPRPFVTEHVKPLISHPADNGFPSDHALLTMTLTAITYYFSRKIAAIMLVFTILVGVARVLAKVHSPIDIAAGWAIGIVGAVAGYYAMRLLQKKYMKQAETES